MFTPRSRLHPHNRFMTSITWKLPGYKNPWDIYIRLGYVLAQQLDLAMTLFAVSRGHTELNPFMQSILNSPPQLIAFKLIIPMLIAWLIPAKYILPGLLLMLLINVISALQLAGII